MSDRCEICGRVSGHTFKLVRLHRIAPWAMAEVSTADIQRAIRDEAHVWICGPDCRVRGELLLCERERRRALTLDELMLASGRTVWVSWTHRGEPRGPYILHAWVDKYGERRAVACTSVGIRLAGGDIQRAAEAESHLDVRPGHYPHARTYLDSPPPPQPRRNLHDPGRADERGLEVGELEHDPRASE